MVSIKEIREVLKKLKTNNDKLIYLNKLLEEVNKQGQKNKRVIDCLLQIFIASEETKFGLSFEECGSILNSEEFKKMKGQL